MHKNWCVPSNFQWKNEWKFFGLLDFFYPQSIQLSLTSTANPTQFNKFWLKGLPGFSSYFMLCIINGMSKWLCLWTPNFPTYFWRSEWFLQPSQKTTLPCSRCDKPIKLVSELSAPSLFHPCRLSPSSPNCLLTPPGLGQHQQWIRAATLGNKSFQNPGIILSCWWVYPDI